MNDQPRIRDASPARPVESASETAVKRPQNQVGFWGLLRTVFIGSTGLAIISVAAILATNIWLTTNQRAEAEKTQLWADPSFTTTAVTTGGMLARWMDNDSNLSNGHSYIKGIYDLWKVKHKNEFEQAIQDTNGMPQLWTIEFRIDAQAMALNDKMQVRRQGSTIARQALESMLNSGRREFYEDPFRELFLKKGNRLELGDYIRLFKEESFKQGLALGALYRADEIITRLWSNPNTNIPAMEASMLAEVENMTPIKEEQILFKQSIEATHQRIARW